MLSNAVCVCFFGSLDFGNWMRRYFRMFWGSEGGNTGVVLYIYSTPDIDLKFLKDQTDIAP